MNQPTRPPTPPLPALRTRCARLLGIALLLLCSLAVAVPPAYGATGTLTVGSEIIYANWSTNVFSVNGNEAYCGEPDRETPGAGSYSMESLTDPLVAAALWYGYGGPGFDKALWPSSYYNGSAMGANEYRVLTHVALVYLRTGDIAYACVNTKPAFKSWCEQNVFGYAPDGSVRNTNAICYRIKASGFTIGGASDSRTALPKGFTAYRFATGAGNQVMFTSAYVPHGWVEVSKKSGNPPLSDQNPSYSLEGGQYGLYADAACTNLVTTLTTNADGWARSELVPSGAYYLKEIAAPPGYALSAETVKVNVPTRAAAQAECSDLPQANPIELCIQKKDRETSEAAPQGGATLAGAEYLLRFFGGTHDSLEAAEAAGEPLRSWTLRTASDGRALLDDEHKVSGDDFYRDSADQICLPLGTLIITEAKAPMGYLLDTTPIVCPIIAEGEAEQAGTFAVPDHPEQVIRGDLNLVKVRESDQSRLAGVPFLLTSLTTGESHLLVTDENGQANTAASYTPHTHATNANDAALNRDGTVDEAKLDPHAGIWFGSATPDDNHGALIYDKYRLEELRCSANEGLELITLPSIAITRDGYEFDVGTLDNQPESSMYIRTTARDASDGDKQLAPDTLATIVDRVEYHNVAVGEDYLMWGSLMQRSTGQPITDEHGSAVMAQLPFTAEEANGYVELEFAVDTTAYSGEDIVVCEDLIDATTGATITSDFDLDNYDETVTVPSPVPPDEAPLGKTGDKHLTSLAVLGAVGAGAAGALAWRRFDQRRKQRAKAQRLIGNLIGR